MFLCPLFYWTFCVYFCELGGTTPSPSLEEAALCRHIAVQTAHSGRLAGQGGGGHACGSRALASGLSCWARGSLRLCGWRGLLPLCAYAPLVQGPRTRTRALAEGGLVRPNVPPPPSRAALFGWLELVCFEGPGLATGARQLECPDLAPVWTLKVERGGKQWCSPAFPTPGRVLVLTTVGWLLINGFPSLGVYLPFKLQLISCAPGR